MLRSIYSGATAPESHRLLRFTFESSFEPSGLWKPCQGALTALGSLAIGTTLTGSRRTLDSQAICDRPFCLRYEERLKIAGAKNHQARSGRRQQFNSRGSNVK